MSHSPVSSILVPREGYTLADDPISLSFSAAGRDVLFLAIPPSPEAISAAVDDIRHLLRNIVGGVLFISDTDEPASLSPEDPTLVQLCSDFGAHVLQYGCVGQLGRIVAALDLESGGNRVSGDVCKYVAGQFTDTHDPRTHCFRFVAEYDRKLVERKKTEEYRDIVKRLQEILAGIKDVLFAFDLEGTLVGYYLDTNDKSQKLSYVLRPFAAEILAILSENNTVSLCTLASRILVRAILEQTKLHLPEGTQIMSAQDIQRINTSKGLDNPRIKVPSWYGNVLIDDQHEKHLDRVWEAGFYDEEHRFIGIRTFDYANFSSLETYVQESDVLNLAEEIARRFT